MLKKRTRIQSLTSRLELKNQWNKEEDGVLLSVRNMTDFLQLEVLFRSSGLQQDQMNLDLCMIAREKTKQI